MGHSIQGFFYKSLSGNIKCGLNYVPAVGYSNCFRQQDDEIMTTQYFTDITAVGVNYTQDS